VTRLMAAEGRISEVAGMAEDIVEQVLDPGLNSRSARIAKKSKPK
jgi:hypothetical protein